MPAGTFVTTINCMDGRVQDPVNLYLKKRYGADHVDVITNPGPIKILADDSPAELVRSIKDRVAISVEQHGSGVIALVGHHDCAGNPVDKNKQLEQLAAAEKKVASWEFPAKIIKMYVNDDWQVEVL